MREQILQVCRVVLGGSKRVRITYKESAVTNLSYLRGMVNRGIVQLSRNDLLVLDAGIAFGEWDGDAGRTFIVTLTDLFDENLFVTRMEDALEKIEVA